MEARVTLRPGSKGTKKLTAEFGDRLVCVRYRYDIERRRRYKTVEIIVDEADWQPVLPLRAGSAAQMHCFRISNYRRRLAFAAEKAADARFMSVG